MQSLLQRTTAFLTPNSSSTNLSHSNSSTNLSNSNSSPSPTTTISPSSSSPSPPTTQYIFPPVSPLTDGPTCLHSCTTCTITYPPKWSIDDSPAPLYGHISSWSTHLLIATGKTDWVRDVADEPRSLMQAIAGLGLENTELANGRCMVSACDMLVPEYESESGDGDSGREDGETEVLVLPRWEVVQRVKPSAVRAFMEGYVARVATNESRIVRGRETSGEEDNARIQRQPSPASGFHTRPLPHSYLILLCSQRSRDARCGQSAPLLRREFERHLRPLGLYRDRHDQRPGGVGIYFVSHVGGHRYAANVLVYRKEEPVEGGERGDGGVEERTGGEAMQCIWLARVRPEDCEGIVKYTLLQGKVVKPERQLRGGFDRVRGLTSW